VPKKKAAMPVSYNRYDQERFNRKEGKNLACMSDDFFFQRPFRMILFMILLVKGIVLAINGLIQSILTL
jgi:hypothetical protein